MITIFNRKRLILDSSAEEAARTWSILREKGIPYTIKTVGMGSSLGRMVHARMGMSWTNGAQRFSDTVDTPNYCYAIYVHRRHYARARAAIN